jgi:hypothetical protein
MVPGFEQDLVAQLNDVCSDRSSPEYQKYRQYITGMAILLGEKFRLRFLRTYMQANGPVELNESLDELFDMLGCRWLKYNQFEEALEAFKTCVEISEREGCWWPQKICARYAHLAFAHMSLGNKPEQLRASIQAVAFAIIECSRLAPQWVCRLPARIHVRLLGPCFKTGRMESSIRQRPERAGALRPASRGARLVSRPTQRRRRATNAALVLFWTSLVNLAAQFLGRIPDRSWLTSGYTVAPVQV